MALSNGDLRNQVGCWSCIHCKIKNIAVDAEASCNHPKEDIKNNFHGWDTAKVCKGYCAKSFSMEEIIDT